MELRQLATFRMVAATLSFTQAAAALGYVQSSVTAQIQALEGELGVRLFDRLGKRIALTDAGERLLRYADQMLALAEEARVAVTESEAPVGTLTLSAPETLCTYRLPVVLREFRARFPQVRLLFRPSAAGEMQRLAADGTLDVAFVLAEPVRAQGLRVEALLPEPILVLAPPGHGLTAASEVRAVNLAGEPILLTEQGCNYRSLFERALSAAGVYPSTTLEFGSVEAIKQCVMAGMGITVLPAVAVAAEVAQGRLVALPWADRPLDVVTQLLWHKDKWLSPALGAFLDLAREMLGPVS